MTGKALMNYKLQKDSFENLLAVSLPPRFRGCVKILEQGFRCERP